MRCVATRMNAIEQYFPVVLYKKMVILKYKLF